MPQSIWSINNVHQAKIRWMKTLSFIPDDMFSCIMPNVALGARTRERCVCSQGSYCVSFSFKAAECSNISALVTHLDELTGCQCLQSPHWIKNGKVISDQGYGTGSVQVGNKILSQIMQIKSHSLSAGGSDQDICQAFRPCPAGHAVGKRM